MRRRSLLQGVIDELAVVVEGSPLLLLWSDFVEAFLDECFELLLVESNVLALLQFLLHLALDH